MLSRVVARDDQKSPACKAGLGREPSKPGSPQAKPHEPMKTRKKDQRGALGNIVASHNRFGDYDRERVHPKTQSTPALERAWGNLTNLSELWNEITEAQRDGWWRLAVQVHSRPRMG